LEPEFWHQRWQSNEIGFHLDQPNPWLLRYFGKLDLAPRSRILLPLCGKTRDIGWLLLQGMKVVGVELSRLAVEALFDQLKISPVIKKIGAFEIFQGPGLEILAGDFFKLTEELISPVDAIYDRAALVALPEEMRSDYSSALMSLTRQAPQLVITYQYDQSKHAGPPFSVTDDEVRQLYGDIFEISLVDKLEVKGGLKGLIAATESLFLLQSP